ncbi:MAG: T9SS type A sorting domain-containing protein [Bacteroidia bacterium]|nr:T9SS type A sorting domain-containing protein [Bacteroidia bacterium]
MNLKSIILYLVLIGLGLPGFGQFINWQFENISDDLEESGANPHLIADPLGNLHLTYWKKNLDRLVYGIRRNGSGNWIFQDVPDTGTFGYKSAIKVNNQGIVYIAYFKNQGGDASLSIATYDGSNWTFEDASEGNTVGVYGYDASFPTLVQPSIDLEFDQFDEPVILYFNSFYSRIKDCRNDPNIDRIYSQYRMDMNMAVRRGPNAWEEVQFPELAYFGSQPCVENGDRFGEYCNIIKADDSTYLAITTSMHNNELLLYRSTDDSLKTWSRHVLDRTSRLFSILNSHFYETFGYIDAQMSNDSTLHLTYNISNHYGYARRIFLSRLSYFYSRVNINRLDEVGYQPYIYNHSPTTLAAFENTLLVKGDSNITVAFFERLKSLALSANSRDGGQTWDLDTLSGFATNAPFQSALVGDTAYIMAYFSPGDRLIMAKRDLDDSSWILEDVTQTQTTGQGISSVVFEENGNRNTYIATQTDQTDRLLFAANSGPSWDFEEVDVTEGGLAEASMYLDDQNTPSIAYMAQDSLEIRLATRLSQGNWGIEVVSDTSLGKDITALYENGNSHLIFFNLSGGYLEHLYRASGQNNWQSTIVDSSSSIVGSAAKAVLDENGGLHVSYIDLINFTVKYAYLPKGGVWTSQDVINSGQYSPKSVAIALDTLGTPNIVFADGQKDTLFYLYPVNQTWNIDRLEGEFTDFSGDAIGLLVDDQNQAWVLYNYQTFIQDLRLFYRQANGFWQQVSITNNQAEISNSFDFFRFGDDLYISGKKNQTNNTGLGLLYAENGILADWEGGSDETALKIYPNPSKGIVKIAWGDNLINTSANINVYNLSGQILYHKGVYGITPGTETELDLGNLDAGVFILQVQLDDKSYTRRLVLLP